MSKIDGALVFARRVFALGVRKGYVGKRGLDEAGPYVKEWAGWFFKVYATSLSLSLYSQVNERYADRYLFGKRSGGGMELVDVSMGGGIKRTFMRVYIGAILDEESLSKFGIGQADVISFLKQALLAAGEKARWDEEYQWKRGDWHYHCQPFNYIVDENTGISTFEVRERILYYKGDRSLEVCWHKFMFIEVK